MSLQTSGAPSSGIWGAVKGALNIFSSINKADGPGEYPANPIPADEFESSLSEEEIIELVRTWRDSYRKYYQDGVESSQTKAFEYWIGKHKADEADQIQDSLLVDNKIFEAIETFIPIATRSNPDPLVKADPSDLGQKLAKNIKNAIVYEADTQKLRKILKGVLRDWIICRLGLVKIGFDVHTQRITTEKINPRRWMGDKDGHWDEAGIFTGEWQAEKKKASAKRLSEMFPKKAAEIKEKANGRLGTKLEYIEWWYKGRDVFYTIDDMVLGKYKNPHWNFDIPAAAAELDDEGNEITPEQPFVEGKNHWKKPIAPYFGLSIFSTGLQPHDETGLVIQNIGTQDEINKTGRQISKNVEGMNNGMILSDDFTSEQASQAAAALRRGIAIRAPSKDVSKAAMRFPPTAIPSDVFEHLRDMREELANIFGTSGSTPQSLNDQKTVRGKILINQLDASRIGGGVTEYLEQLADTVYNAWVQMMFVHYTEPHWMVAAGQIDGAEQFSIVNTELGLLKSIDITVKEGSLIPKDPLTQRNEAMDLWSAGAIDPINFYKKLDHSDPVNSAKQLIIWQMVQKGQLPPTAYIPDFQIPEQAMAQMQGLGATPGVGGPAINPIDASKEQNTPAPTSPEAVAAESKQLIRAVPE